MQMGRNRLYYANIDQVKTKGYDRPYRADGRPVWLVGLSFDRETRQLADAKVEPLAVKQ